MCCYQTFAVLLAIAAAAAPAAGRDYDRSCVKVLFTDVTEDAAGTTHMTDATGSGTVVACEKGKSLVLTNRHVAPHKYGIIHVRFRGSNLPAEWVAADAGPDLALIRVNADLLPVKIADADPPDRSLVGQWGYSRSGPMKAKTGYSAGTITGSEGTILRTTIDIEPGDSGSGVFNADGALIGVAYSAGTHTDGRYEHCVRLEDVKKFLDKYAK